MYNISTKNIKKGSWLWILFLAIGIIFLLAISYMLFFNTNKMKDLDGKVLSYEVDVEIRQGDTGAMYSPTYKFRVGEKSYSCPSNISSSIYPSSENKYVYYSCKHCNWNYSRN